MTSEVHLVTQRTSMDQYEAFFGSMNLGRSNWLGKLGFPGLSEWVYWPKNNGSVVERFVHIEDVGGSNPSSPTIPSHLAVRPVPASYLCLSRRNARFAAGLALKCTDPLATRPSAR